MLPVQQQRATNFASQFHTRRDDAQSVVAANKAYAILKKYAIKQKASCAVSQTSRIPCQPALCGLQPRPRLPSLLSKEALLTARWPSHTCCWRLPNHPESLPPLLVAVAHPLVVASHLLVAAAQLPRATPPAVGGYCAPSRGGFPPVGGPSPTPQSRSPCCWWQSHFPW